MGAPGCFPHAAQFLQVSGPVHPLPGARQPGHGEYAEKFPVLDAPPQVRWVWRPQRQRSVGRSRGPASRVPLVIREGSLVTEGDDLLEPGVVLRSLPIPFLCFSVGSVGVRAHRSSCSGGRFRRIGRPGGGRGAALA